MWDERLENHWRGRRCRSARPADLAVRGETVHTFHMGYYLLEYALIDDYLARRAAFGMSI